MQIAILDGYIDEPACLGVPPYISPHVRYLSGGISNAGKDHKYLTIDEYRQGSNKIEELNKSDLLVIVAGAVVPGKYLGGTPVSFRECNEIAETFSGITVLGGPSAEYGFFDSRSGNTIEPDRNIFDHICSGDIDACISDFLEGREFTDRRRTVEEQNVWSVKGAGVVRSHPNYPGRLIAELESYKGCVRFHTGGCSFCIEPEYGEPRFRDQKDIINEVKELKRNGLDNFRMGGQSCIYSYKSRGVGTEETPEPDPEEIDILFKGLRKIIGPEALLHVDNANPAVIAAYPDESRVITKTLIKYCTSGNVVAFGLESTDPAVIKANNLNTEPDQVMKAIEIVNESGREKGSTGLPKLLPGLNFITGLPGESRKTFELNLDFLRKVIEKGFLIRRINIRQVARTRTKFKYTRYNKEFRIFKKSVREEIDGPVLEKVVPLGTVLRAIVAEAHEGNITFGRQLGTYPILVGIPYKLPLELKLDVVITEHGYRSVTGVQYPFPINNAKMSQIKTLPGLGARRAARIVKARPISGLPDLKNALDSDTVAEELDRIITYKSTGTTSE